MLPTIGELLPNGATILAFANVPLGYVILGIRAGGGFFQPFATWLTPENHTETVHGNYFHDVESAMADFKRRVAALNA